MHLTPEKATDLVKINNHTLNLANVTSLCPESARILSHGVYELLLDGLNELTPDIAEALVTKVSERSPARILSLGGVTHLSAETAAMLAKHEGYELHLNGLAALSLESAKALATLRHQPGCQLHLLGICSLPPDVAHALLSYKGDGVRFNGTNPRDPEDMRGRWLDCDGSSPGISQRSTLADESGPTEILNKATKKKAKKAAKKRRGSK